MSTKPQIDAPKWIHENRAMIEGWIDSIDDYDPFAPTIEAQIFITSRVQPFETMWIPNLTKPAAEMRWNEYEAAMIKDVRQEFRTNLAMVLVFGAKARFKSIDYEANYAPGFFATYNRLPTARDKVRIIGHAMKEPEARRTMDEIVVGQVGLIEGVKLKTELPNDDLVNAWL